MKIPQCKLFALVLNLIYTNDYYCHQRTKRWQVSALNQTPAGVISNNILTHRYFNCCSMINDSPLLSILT